MDRPTLQELVDTKLPEMPAKVRAVLESEETSKQIERVADNNKLSDDQTDKLFDEVSYTLFGINSLTSFKKNLEKNLGLANNQAISINASIYGQVFLPVKSFLKETDGETAKTSNDPSMTSQNILKEIENPTASIAPAKPSTPKIEAEKPSELQKSIDSALNLGGFNTTAPAANPAQPVADKLDKKLSAPVSSAPKEIYQIKKSDPYHEPIEL